MYYVRKNCSVPVQVGLQQVSGVIIKQLRWCQRLSDEEVYHVRWCLCISHSLPVRCWCSRELWTFEKNTWQRYVSILLQGMFGSVIQTWDFLCRRVSTGEDERSGRCPVSDHAGSAGGGRAARDGSWHHCTGLPSDSTRHWGHTSFAVSLNSVIIISLKKQFFIPAGLIFISMYPLKHAS